MNSKSLAVVVLLLSCGSALAAEKKFESVQVRPQAHDTLAVACDATALNAYDVEQVLKINDHSQTRELSNHLLDAVNEACRAGIDSIAVQRAATGHSVTWARASAADANVALVLRNTSVATN